MGAGSTGLLSHTELSVAFLRTFSGNNLAHQDVSYIPLTLLWCEPHGKLPIKLMQKIHFFSTANLDGKIPPLLYPC